MDLYEIVKKLNGPIYPQGDTCMDDTRFTNLEKLTSLVDKLLSDIDDVAALKGSHEYSVSRAGNHANAFLESIGVEK